MNPLAPSRSVVPSARPAPPIFESPLGAGHGAFNRHAQSSWRLIVAGVALAVTALGAGCSRTQDESASGEASLRTRDFVRLAPGNPRLDFIKIETVTVARECARIRLPGKIAFDEDHTQRVASPIDGRALALLVKVGDHVRAGQPLIQLSSPRVGELQADAQKAMSDLNVSEKAVDRVHRLKADGAISEKEVAQVEGDYKKAKSDFARAAAQLRALGISASEPAVNVALRAQLAGVVVERNVLAGQEVRADSGAPLLTISDLDTVWAIADVYEQDLNAVREGAAVTTRVAAYPDATFPGKVTHVGDLVDPTTRTVKVRCVTANPGHRLKPEMFADVDIEADKVDKAIEVPAAAVLNDGDKNLVIVATEGNVFRSRRVRVGPETDGRVRIVSGVTPGEKIVTNGAIFMKQELD